MANKAPMLFVLLLFAVLINDAQALLTTQRFKYWFWDNETYDFILRENCSTEYSNYVNHYDNQWYRFWPGHATRKREGYWVYMFPVIQCLLDTTTEMDKSTMASAGILLGLMPSILAYAGSSLTETALLSMRRPMLAFLLAMGSPSVPPLRAFSHEDIPNMLTRRKGGMTMQLLKPTHSRAIRASIVMIELALSLGAIANVVYTSYELGVKAIIIWSSNDIYHPLLWALLTVPIHVWGFVVLRVDVKKVCPPRRKNESIWQRVKAWAGDEFTPCASQQCPTILRYKPDTFRFILLSWWAALLTLAHLIYGTIVFSCVLFVSIHHALQILIRFLLSALCCRVIVMFELTGMRHISQTRETPLPNDSEANPDNAFSKLV